MGWIKDQFLDVIEYIDESDKILVHKYNDRPRNEIKQGAKAIIREGQCGVFVKGGQIADIWKPGTYKLNSENEKPLMWLYWVKMKRIFKKYYKYNT